MIIVDLETTGISPIKNGIASIGGVTWPKRAEFYVETRVFPDQEIEDEALSVNGFTRQDVTDATRPLVDAELLEQLVYWANQEDDLILAGWNVSFDRDFLLHAFQQAAMAWPFGYRLVDFHSIAYTLMSEIDHFVPAHNKTATVGLNYALRWAGLPEEPTPHNALTGAKCNADLYAHFQKMLAGGLSERVRPPNCPKCGKIMALRRPKAGGKQFEPFWGCTGYPDCRMTDVYEGA